MRYVDSVECSEDDLHCAATIIALRLEEARRATLQFGICVLLLTPFIAVAGMVVAAMVFAEFLAARRHGMQALANLPVNNAQMFASIAAIFLLVLWLVFVFNQLKSRRRKWLARIVKPGGMAAFFCAVTWGTTMAERWPWTYCILFATLLTMTLVNMGRTYDPEVILDEMLDNDLWHCSSAETQQALAAFFVSAMLPSCLLEMYAQLLSDSWVWRRLKGSELDSAARLLYAVANFNPKAQERILRSLEPVAAVHTLRVMERLKLIYLHRHHLELTSEGERIVGRIEAPSYS